MLLLMYKRENGGPCLSPSFWVNILILAPAQMMLVLVLILGLISNCKCFGDDSSDSMDSASSGSGLGPYFTSDSDTIFLVLGIIFIIVASVFNYFKGLNSYLLFSGGSVPIVVRSEPTGSPPTVSDITQETQNNPTEYTSLIEKRREEHQKSQEPGERKKFIVYLIYNIIVFLPIFIIDCYILSVGNKQCQQCCSYGSDYACGQYTGVSVLQSPSSWQNNYNY